MTTVELAKNYEELLGPSVAASPYEFATLFKAEGFMGKRRCKQRLKLLKAVDFKLRHILERGEKVHFITTGTTVGMTERFLAGWIAYYLDRRILVFTSRRVLLLLVSARQQPMDLVSQLPYANIAGVKSTWGGMCTIKLLNRVEFNFQHIPAPDRKFLVDFLADIVQLTNAPFEHTRAIENLCPHCYTFIPDFPRSCSSCKGEFKSSRMAGFLSLLFPGLGGFYLGHRLTATVELLGTVALWVTVVGLPFLGVSNFFPRPLDTGYWMTIATVILIVHGIDSLVTHHFARKGIYPSGAAPLQASLPPFVDRPKPDLNGLNKLKINRTSPPI
jgi:hypothetical protein